MKLGDHFLFAADTHHFEHCLGTGEFGHSV